MGADDAAGACANGFCTQATHTSDSNANCGKFLAFIAAPDQAFVLILIESGSFCCGFNLALRIR